MAKTYRAGIVGCGRIGSEFDDDPKRKSIASHAGAYSAVKRTELVAVCDADKVKLEKCGKRWNVPELYSDLEEMLEKERLDILSICTWNSTHLALTEQAVAHGVKAIFCEKPLADGLESGRRIVKLCKDNGVILQVDHQRRFCTFHQRLQDHVRKGKIGPICQAAFYYSNGISNTGSHMIDLLRFFLGDVEWVWGFKDAAQTGNEADPNIDAMLKFKDGTVCSLHALDHRDFLLFEMDLIGTLGRLRITHSGFDLDYFKVGPSKYFSGYKEPMRAKPPVSKDLPRNNMVNGVKHLVECIDKRKESISSGEDGRKALEVIVALHESVRRGSRVDLPLEKSDIIISAR